MSRFQGLLLVFLALSSPHVWPYLPSFVTSFLFSVFSGFQQYILPIFSVVNACLVDLVAPLARPLLARLAHTLPVDFEFIGRHVRSDRMSALFVFLFIFRYLRLVVHLVSFWFLYRPTPVPANPTLRPSDCTVILPTVDPKNQDFEECLTSTLINGPGAIVIVTVGDELARVTKEVVEPFRHRFPATRISIKTTNVANKRTQVAHGLRYVKTKITVLLDDHVFWPSTRFLPTLLAPFEDPKVGIVGTNKRVRRTDKGFNIRSFWNMIGALYLERHNFEIRATNAVDGGVFVISGRTSAHRSEILTNPDFILGFTSERFFFGKFGPLNADDDNFITRWNVKHGYKIKIQYCTDALIETTLGTYPKFLSQCLRWVRTTWRSNSASLFTDRTVWYRQPWCVYAVYLTSFVNFALFYDGALVYTLTKSRLANDGPAVSNLVKWIFWTKMVKLTPYYLREPQDLVMLPGYFVFAYFHSLIKLYAGLTFWETNWGGRNLDAINQGQVSGNNSTDASANAIEDNEDHDIVIAAPRRGPGRPPSQTPRPSYHSNPRNDESDHSPDGGVVLVSRQSSAPRANPPKRNNSFSAAAAASHAAALGASIAAGTEPPRRGRGRPPKRR